MNSSVNAKYLRVSPRKLTLLAKSIVGKSVAEADFILTFLNKSGAKEFRKAVNSAVSNVLNRNLAARENLHISKIEVLSGPAMKRFRAVSRGMAHTYKKRMSHIRVVITDQKTNKPSLTKAVEQVVKSKSQSV